MQSTSPHPGDVVYLTYLIFLLYLMIFICSILLFRLFLSLLLNVRVLLFSSLLTLSLPVLGWSVSVFIVEGRICEAVGRLVEFSVDVSYLPLHSLVCEFFS